MHIVFLKAIRKPDESEKSYPIDADEQGGQDDLDERHAEPDGDEGQAGAGDDDGDEKVADVAQGEEAAEAAGDGDDQEGVPEGFGPHNVEPGHHVAFKAGEFQGSGKVNAAGEDGCTVADKTGREHRVHWSEVTGHHPGA